MTKIEALAKLTACVPLVNRLETQDKNIELTQHDLSVLAGLEQIWAYEDGYWFNDLDIYQQAGLSLDQFRILDAFAVQVEIKRRKSESGEARPESVEPASKQVDYNPAQLEDRLQPLSTS